MYLLKIELITVARYAIFFYVWFADKYFC